jgi:hypothetical protein
VDGYEIVSLWILKIKISKRFGQWWPMPCELEQGLLATLLWWTGSAKLGIYGHLTSASVALAELHQHPPNLGLGWTCNSAGQILLD